MGLYMGGLKYGWAYIRNGESVSKLVGLYMGGLMFGGIIIIMFIYTGSLFQLRKAVVNRGPVCIIKNKN